MRYLLFALLCASSYAQTDSGLIPLQATLEVVKVVEPIEVTEIETISGLYRPHVTVDLRLTLKNPMPEPVSIDMEDTPLDVLLMGGTLPEDYFSHRSDVVWAGHNSEFAKNDVEGLTFKCTEILPEGELVVDFTLGANDNNYAFSKSSGSAEIALEFEIRECQEGAHAHTGRGFHVISNSVSVEVTSAEQAVGWSDQWIGRGYVETDDDGMFYWVSTFDDPGRFWSHPSVPRTITFASGDNYEDCHDSITFNGISKTLQEWVLGLEEDKRELCAATIYHMSRRTPEFYQQFEYHFKMDFTEEKFEDLKGRIARLCSADGYEYNCNPMGTCNMGLDYRHCESTNPKYEYSQRCSIVHPPVDFIHQSEVVNLEAHQHMDLTELRQAMTTCSLDKRNCQEGDIPTASGGVIAYVDSLEDWEFGGKRTINICPLYFWQGWNKAYCRLLDIADQLDYQNVYEYDRETTCWTSAADTIFHELAHFSDIANAVHDGQLDNNYYLAGFLAGIGQKPLPPTQAPTTPDPTSSPTPRPTNPPISGTSLKPSKAPVKMEDLCVDGAYCSTYSYYIQSNPEYYCSSQFGINGYYCTSYSSNIFCCPVMCGDCDNMESKAESMRTEAETEVGEQVKPEYATYGSYTLQTHWTLPQWLDITWENFPKDVPAVMPDVTTDCEINCPYFTVTGDCDTRDNCVSSGNYPGVHENNEECTITMVQDAFLTTSATFSLETCCDHLIIQGNDVESSDEVPTSLNARDQFTWSSDYSVTKEGWEICFSSESSSENAVADDSRSYSHHKINAKSTVERQTNQRLKQANRALRHALEELQSN